MISGRLLLSCSLALLAILCACEDEDMELPLVSVLSPSVNATFSVFDTLTVAYQASDNRVVTQVTVCLVNDDFIPVTGQVSHTIDKVSHSGTAELVIDDRQLVSGRYFVMVTASDGTNDRSAFVEVTVNEYPLFRRGVFFADMNAAGQGTVFQVDSIFSSVSLFHSPGQDLARISVTSFNDRITIVGHRGAGIMQYDLISTGQRWSASAANQPPAPTYHDMVTYGSQIFASLYTRELRAYSIEGALILNRQFEYDRPHTLHADDRHVFVELREIGGGQQRLLVLRQHNFSEKWLVALPIEIVAFCSKGADEVFIFGNDGPQARVLLYNAETNGWWEPRQLPQGRILHAVKGQDQVYFLAMESGLYRYTFSPNHLSVVRPGIIYQRLRHDRADGLILGADRGTLDVISEQNGMLLTSVQHTDSITDIDIRYSK